MLLLKIFSLTGFFIVVSSANIRFKKSIDLIAAQSVISEARLPREVTPDSYNIELEISPKKGIFRGRVKINITWQEPTDEILLHASPDLQFISESLTLIGFTDEQAKVDPASQDKSPAEIPIKERIRLEKESLFKLQLEKSQTRGTLGEVDIAFHGNIPNDTSEGIFRNFYLDAETLEMKWFVALNLRPNLARRVFPCFDEPGYKVPFKISIGRPSSMKSFSNMPVENTEVNTGKPGLVWDYYQQTPPMSTFSLGVVVGEFYCVNEDNSNLMDMFGDGVRIWARSDFVSAIQNVSEKVEKSLKVLEGFWATPFPLPKLDIVALPNFQARPADSWGLLLFKESELSGRGSSHITQELVYQWLGALATPFWWNDAQINNALVHYLTAYTTKKVDENETFNNWPMTMLYSIYYEFSKRYPHGKSTAIKQDSASAKTELVFRMLNYTLGERTFIRGLQKFMVDKQYKTFYADDIWDTLTAQARFDKVLEDGVSVNEIAASWVTKDRLPVVTVIRDYEKETATLTQRVYLRERPHDVPDQDKFIWWIPIVLVSENNLNFSNSTPTVWMKREREIELNNMPDEKHFIIVNPEEIGPFPVNYDTRNWNMLAQFLCSEQRTKIPVNTRAKLLHDAWNLAYAGNLSFATALNLTLFLKHEREYLAWDPVFTLIDHIGRHIDSSAVFRKFQAYVRQLLTPLYEELGEEPQEGECDGITHLRSSSKIFLCQAGYQPCVQEAQKAYRKWMESKNPDDGNPVANQYICPVFKWGTKEEWEFGLQRILNFPATRKPNERTYLLKTLAGCPNDPAKIERLLNITVLQQNEKFTDKDIYLIFSMLTGSSNGYTTLFNFLKANWEVIKERFKDKPQLWNSIVTSATSVFKTQEGLDMVSELYVERQEEFGTADFVIERALKNIKEETKWSNENLPVIEKWLDQYLKDNGVSLTETTTKGS